MAGVRADRGDDLPEAAAGGVAIDVAGRLAAASRALVVAGGGLVAAAGGAAPGDALAEGPAMPTGPGADWSVDASLLSYSESDERVDVRKALATLSRETDSDSVGVELVHDTMSGASPTGALRGANGAVTYSGTSGAAAGDPPGDASAEDDDGALAAFDDERLQASASLARAVGRNLELELGGVVSRESDYDSVGGSLTATRESADRLSGVELGVALTTDTIERSDVGGTPEPLADAREGVAFGRGTRHTVDLSLGLSRVLNRTTLARVTLQLGRSDGYHTDPYKVISEVDAAGDVVANRYESRPEDRLRTSLGASIVHRLADAPHSVQLDYRFYVDDWGVVSNTLDARYRHRLTTRQYLEPHARFYLQGAADFYAPFLESRADGSLALPAGDGHASADYRLDALSSVTLGLKYGIELAPGLDLRVRGEYLGQRFDTAEYGALGAGIVQTSLGWTF